MDFYFKKYEHRTPPPPTPYSLVQEVLYQITAVITIVLGGWYIYWRWTSSLNLNALWFAIPLVIAETMMYIGSILSFLNYWMIRDYEEKAPPEFMDEVVPEKLKKFYKGQPISIDIYVAVYNEDPELVRLSIKDAKKVKKLPNWKVNIYVLDDSKNPAMKKMIEEEGVIQITRDNRKGYKAGAITDAMTKTEGHFIVICDADTRLFPSILIDTMGFFRDPKVAFVQTPQWFYDVPEGKRLHSYLREKFGKFGELIGIGIEKLFGEVRIGYDPFGVDPRMFYDVIQRRRNAYNAPFCCGAASIHRRTALELTAIERFVDRVTKAKDKEKAIKELDLEYFVFHVSEDIYTTIFEHSSSVCEWKTVLYPKVESKMLSPQDLLSWSVQQFKYAGGTLDIAKREKFLVGKNMSLGQKLMYWSTMWSYITSIAVFIFLLAPIVYFFTGIPPVTAYSSSFFLHILPFLIANELAFMIATWGINTQRGSQYYIAKFPLVLKAMWKVLKGETIRFTVTPKIRQHGNFLALVRPQLAIVLLTVLGAAFNGILILLGERHNLVGYLTNLFWSYYNVSALLVIIRAALISPSEEIENEE